MRSMMLFLCLLLVRPAPAIEIPAVARVANWGGYCTWASLETLARLHGVDKLNGLIRHRWEKNGNQRADTGQMDRVRAQLDVLAVKYLAEDDYVRNSETLRKYAVTHGVVVTLLAGNGHAHYRAKNTSTGSHRWSSGCHSIVLSNFGDLHVEFYDSSRPNGKLLTDPDYGEAYPVFQADRKVWHGTRAWFDRHWAGNAVVILPESPAVAKIVPTPKGAPVPPAARVQFIVAEGAIRVMIAGEEP